MNLTVQFSTLFSMIGVGILLGMSLETFQRFLKRTKRKKWVVFINDLLFWIIQALLIFYILLQVNEGELRIYVFLALLLGFSFYQALLKKSYILLLERVIHGTITVAKAIKMAFLKLIYTPIKWLVMTFVAILLWLYHVAKKILYFLWTIIWKIVRFHLNLIKSILLFTLNIFWKLIPIKVRKKLRKIEGVLHFMQNKKKRIVSWMKSIKKSNK